MLKWSNVQMVECSNGRMSKWTNVQMVECSNVQMCKWLNGRIVEWQNSLSPYLERHPGPAHIVRGEDMVGPLPHDRRRQARQQAHCQEQASGHLDIVFWEYGRERVVLGNLKMLFALMVLVH